jgi:putative FmdB family regulatory protein
MSPVYEFSCDRHGVFESYRLMTNCTEPEPCPKCKTLSERIISLPSVRLVQGAKSLQFGSGSPGRMVTPKETGGVGIYIPSMGLMEQQEVDYIAEGAIEKEKARVKKKRKTIQGANQAIVQAYVNIANRAPKGQKANAIRKVIKETANV